MTLSLTDQISQLKKQHNILILAHNYQRPEIQDAADFVGDSLDLAIKATKTDADVIVFCGVSFMAEAAKILNPDKTVILPDPTATCPMANMVTATDLKIHKKKHPDAAVMAYINTNADVKAQSDICCTSANGVQVAQSLPNKEIIFVPDQNLGHYIQQQLPDKHLILWPGSCNTHHQIMPDDILKLKKLHPHAETLVHPECRPEVVNIADHAFSTNGMVTYAKETAATEFIIGTEQGLCYRLRKEIPGKTFYELPKALCPNMKKITIETLINSMATLEPEIQLPEKIMRQARIPLQRMMDLGRKP
jgi:quinolinate synthase